MWFTYTRGLMGHTLWQYAKGWVYWALAIGLFLYLPEITFYAQNYLRGAGYTPSPFEVGIFANHRSTALWMLLIAWISLEVQGWWLMKRKAKPFEESRVERLVERHAKKARLWRMPTVVTLPEGSVNAAATESIAFGNKIIVMGRIAEVLDEPELDVVLAHETKHLAHWDIWATIPLHAGSRALAWQKWSLAISAIVGVVQYFLGNIAGGELVFVFTATAILWVVATVYQLLEMAHSRCREYLADGGAIALTSWKHAQYLVSGLLKVGHMQTGWHPFDLLKRREIDILMPHPPIVDRGEVLGVTVQRGRRGEVIVEGTPVAA